MNKISFAFLIASICFLYSCQPDTPFDKDLAFLRKYDSVVVLRQGNSKVIVSPRYQAKVFTSTAGDGSSNGWINYKIFNAPPDPHMNAYGGENRIWLGPEGGPYSLFFPKGFVMDFANWKIPSPFDTEPWELVSASDTSAFMKKDMKLVNYVGTELSLTVNRNVQVLSKKAIEQLIGIPYGSGVKVVAYSTNNSLTNTGERAWTDSSGMPCIWILDMFPPSPHTTVVIPFNKDTTAHPANTHYFGVIPPERIKYIDSILYFKADGQMRSKLGFPPPFAKNIAGSYDEDQKKLTITLFDISPSERYLNMEWDTQKPPYSGDVVNSYNDGPLEDGRMLGPFYELESVSPAAFLAPGQSLNHRHTVFHFKGEDEVIDPICRKTLGVSLNQIKKVFN